MKLVLTGATGTIGGAILRHCLLQPSITSITVLSRRALPFSDPKVSTIIVNDWSKWDDSVLQKIVDADAAIWAVGTPDANIETNQKYPLAFQDAFLKARSAKTRFRFIRVSGAFVEPDQNKSLWFMNEARKVHGSTETKTLDFAKEHHDVWQCFVVKPGGVMTNGAWAMTLGGKLFGSKYAIKDEELGAFVAHLVVEGDEKEGVILNDTMVSKGRALLRQSVK